MLFTRKTNDKNLQEDQKCVKYAPKHINTEKAECEYNIS